MILIIPEKIAIPGFLKIMVFCNKGYFAKITVDNVTKKIVSLYSNYALDLLMWPKFGNSSISMRQVIATSVL